MPATPKNFFRNLRARIGQYESTTGRRISSTTIQGLMEDELNASAETSLRQSAIDADIGYKNASTDIERQKMKDAKSGAMMSGITQVGSTAAQLYLLNRAAGKNAIHPIDWASGKISDLVKGSKGTASGTDLTGSSDMSGTGGMSTPQGEVTGMQPSYSTSAPAPGGGGTPPSSSFSESAMSSAAQQGATTGIESYMGGTVATPYTAGTTAGMEGFVPYETGAPSAVGGVVGPASVVVEGAVAIGEGQEAMRSAQGKSWGESNTVSEKAAKGATQITPWNDESKAGQALNVLTAPISATVGVIKQVEGIVNTVTGGSIICDELCRQGYLPRKIVKLDGEHRRKHIDRATYRGYIAWATPVVALMRRSALVTLVIAPIGRAWAYEMASRMDYHIKGSLLGKLLLKIGVPICRWLGQRGK